MNVKISKKDAISVYQFMEMCGLICTKNTKISHKIMMKKIIARAFLFPEKIIIPKCANLSLVTKEDILTGKIIIVEDDMGKIMIYHNPRPLIFDKILKELKEDAQNKDLEKIRKSIIDNNDYYQNKNSFQKKMGGMK